MHCPEFDLWSVIFVNGTKITDKLEIRYHAAAGKSLLCASAIR